MFESYFLFSQRCSIEDSEQIGIDAILQKCSDALIGDSHVSMFMIAGIMLIPILCILKTESTQLCRFSHDLFNEAEMLRQFSVRERKIREKGAAGFMLFNN